MSVRPCSEPRPSDPRTTLLKQRIFSGVNNLIRSVAKFIVPLRWRNWVRALFAWRWFRGDFATWAEARHASLGYDNRGILAKVVAASREVKAGRALWERDGVPFQNVEINEALYEVLQEIIAAGNHRLELVDFGGGLGGTWWQHRQLAMGASEVHWRVVEQAHYVEAGREFTDDVLTFHASIADALGLGNPSAILLSSVLPYIESPNALLTQIVEFGFEHVIIDRTPFVRKGRTRLAVQFTPPALGGGSYPVWLFDRVDILRPLMEKYVLVREWPALDALSPETEHKGLYFRRKSR